jgi:rhodanese-related sulfurtransferase
MIFKQFYLPCLAHASYLIGDEATGTAAVVDPQRDTNQYVAFAAEFLSSPQPPPVIDVRTPHERDQMYIAGSLGIPLNHLTENLEKLPKDSALLVYCAGGYRSSLAASLLQGSGFDRVSEIAGGITAWEAANLPVHSAAALP